MTSVNDLGTAGQFFVIITLELVVLFIGISFLVGLIREYIPGERIRSALQHRRHGTGNVLGMVFGAHTPFCSCSTITILVGLLYVGIPFGIVYSFLIASPLLNPVFFPVAGSFRDWAHPCLYGHHLHHCHGVGDTPRTGRLWDVCENGHG